MKRIKIICTENDKKQLLNCFELVCPFDCGTFDCDNHQSCSDCYNGNIDFEIIKEEK